MHLQQFFKYTTIFQLSKKKHYDDINIKDERKYIKACITLTFDDDLIERISFNTGKVPIDGTLLLKCLIGKKIYQNHCYTNL